MSAALEFRDVWKSFGPTFIVLRGLSFMLAPGQIALLIGENGAGKTTAFDIASGNLSPDRGEVRIRGIPLVGQSPETLVGFGLRRMYQFPAVFRSLTIRDNILLGVHPELYGRFAPWPLWRKRQELWEKVQHFAAPLFKACPFLQAEDTAAASLSFGQKRILDFTRSVASAGGNSVLLLDEPFAGIHAEVAEVMWDMLRDLAARGASVLLVEHENEASRYNGLPRLSLSYGRVQ